MALSSCKLYNFFLLRNWLQHLIALQILNSFVLIKLVCSFLEHPSATTGALPTLQRTIRLNSSCYACYDIARSIDDKLWLACGSAVLVCTDEGKPFPFGPYPGPELKRWNDATGIAFASNGEAYITDAEAHGLVVCWPNGRFLRCVGSKHTGDPGWLRCPHYAVIDPKSNLLFVTDRGNPVVQVFTLEGVHVRSFGGREIFHGPRGIAICTRTSEIAVADNDGIQVWARSLRLSS